MRKLVTPSEIDRLCDMELDKLFNKISQELVSTAPGTPERRSALGGLENIGRQRAYRAAPPKPGR